ncbi:MAG: TIGR03620 family F420-dependent LLM class oxidoreductase [Gammaproteobacteria bacterium]|nr:TIGR03620 family F420-dependent LLM class oxidoreductase [Gammaproteobacteria bacterium]
MELGRLGVWYGADKLTPAQWKRFVARIESLGYGTLWYSESRGFESLSLGSFLLCNTTRLKVGSSIASIYARDAYSSFAGARTLAQISGNRFVLGLGVSHAPMVEHLRGHQYGKPLSTMRSYLQHMRSAAGDDDHGWPIALAALGPKMLELSRDATRGALPYNVTPEHTERAKRILGPDRWLVVEQKVLLETEPAKARALARAELKRYMSLPNYCNNWRSLGFDDKDLAGDGSDRFMDAMVVWGTQADIEARIQAHFDAGATQVCIQPVHEPGDLDAAERTLEAFAPA